MPLRSRNLVALALDITVVAGLDLHLLRDHLVIDAGTEPVHLDERSIRRLRTLEQIEDAAAAGERPPEHTDKRLRAPRGRADPQRLQALAFALDPVPFGGERTPARIVDEPQTASGLGQAQISVVLAQHQAVLRPAREHAVRLTRASGDQIVHEHAEIGFVTARIPRLVLAGTERGVHPGDEPLRGRLLVAGGAV